MRTSVSNLSSLWKKAFVSEVTILFTVKFLQEMLVMNALKLIDLMNLIRVVVGPGRN